MASDRARPTPRSKWLISTQSTAAVTSPQSPERLEKTDNRREDKSLPHGIASLAHDIVRCSQVCPFAGQGAISGQGSAAVPLLIGGLLLSWADAPGWAELVVS